MAHTTLITQLINLLSLQNCLHNYKGYVHIIGFLCSCDITTATGIPRQKKQFPCWQQNFP